jgi:hypothetical protein
VHLLVQQQQLAVLLLLVVGCWASRQLLVLLG